MSHSGLRSLGKATSFNHVFRAGAWTIGVHYSQFRHSVRQRVSAGEAEPWRAEPAIDFGWGDKIAPASDRLDVFKDAG